MLSGGRFTLGLGAGENLNEHDLMIAVEPEAELGEQFDAADSISCGPDADAHVKAVQQYVAAGFTDVAVVQIGGDTQPGFLDWAEREFLPALQDI